MWKKHISSPVKNQYISVFTQYVRHLTCILLEAFLCTLLLPGRCHSSRLLCSTQVCVWWGRAGRKVCIHKHACPLVFGCLFIKVTTEAVSLVHITQSLWDQQHMHCSLWTKTGEPSQVCFHVLDITRCPSSLGCWILSRTPLGSHYLARNSPLSLSLSVFLSVSLSFCLFLSLLLTQCGSISFSLVRILALCFFQAHLTFPVLFGNYIFIKTKDGKTTFVICSSFLEVICRRLAWRKGKKGAHKSKSHKFISQHMIHIYKMDETHPSSWSVVSLHCGFQPNRGLWNHLCGSH